MISLPSLGFRGEICALCFVHRQNATQDRGSCKVSGLDVKGIAR